MVLKDKMESRGKIDLDNGRELYEKKDLHNRTEQAGNTDLDKNKDNLNQSVDVRKREYQRVYAQIDLDAVEANMDSMKRHVGQNTRMIGVVKADGYGHGGVPIAHCLENKPYMAGFAVATVEEAYLLRRAGIRKPLLVLGYTFPYCYEGLALEEIRPAVFREDSVSQLSQAACRTGKTIRVHVKVDTGMGRVGITPDQEGIDFIRRLSRLPGLEIEGIFTHFAKADEADKTSAKAQYALFAGFCERVEKECMLKIPVKHCSNSAGIVELPETGMDAVRAGITLYGLYPSPQVSRDIIPFRPALSLHSHIVFIKGLHPGQSVSYGGTFTAEYEMRVATIPVGYGDGYPRSLSNRGWVLIRGKRAPILGRICMDQFMVDVTGIPEAREGDLVTLIGRDGGDCITAEELGELSGRFNYELVCDLGKRIPRVYLQGGQITESLDYFADRNVKRYT